MRILFVANTLPPHDISGVGEQVIQLAAGLRKRGHEVRILGRGEGQARGPKLLFLWAVVPPFVRALREFRPHVVQVHESDGALAALAAALLSPLLRPAPRLIALLQVSYVEEIRAVRPLRVGDRVIGRPGGVERRFRWLKAPVQILFGCLTAWLADRVLAPSSRTADELSRDYGIRDVEVLPNAMGRPAADAETGGNPAGHDTLVFVGRLRIRKGLEVLLEALASLRAERPGVRLRVAGDGEHRAAVESAVLRLGLEEAVEVLGRCDGTRVRELLRTSRALVVPSIYEGMPLVILEAMEAGLPVVASEVSGIPEVVIDGESGWLVPAERPGRLAQALLEVLDDPDEAARRGRAGRELLEKRFRPESVACLWEAAVGRDESDTGEMKHG